MAVLKRQTDFSLLEPKSHCILKGLERQHRSLLNSFGLLEANPTLYALHVPGWDLGSLPECTLMADLQQASPAPNIGAFGNTALQRCHQGNAPAFRSHQPQTTPGDLSTAQRGMLERCRYPRLHRAALSKEPGKQPVLIRGSNAR